MSDLNLRPTHRYPEVGRCIYCGTTEPPLSDEHVIPFSLGGHLILPKASCRPCANETHAFEGKTVGTTLRNIRLRYGFPTRRKNQRETHIEIGTIDDRGRTGRRKVPVTEYPVGDFLPHFGRAGLFLDAPPFIDVLQHTAMCYPTDDINEFKRKYSWDGMVTFRHLPVDFARTIVKICYAYAVAELVYNAFTPVCIPYILSKDKNVSYIFGQVGINKPIRGQTLVWQIEMGVLTHNNKHLLNVLCSILPGIGAPIYEVMLGYFQDQAQIAFLSEQFANKRLVVAPLPFA